MVSDRVKYSLLGDTHNDEVSINHEARINYFHFFRSKMISGDEKTPV